MSTAAPLSLERLNELIRLFGEHFKDDLRAERRDAMRSILFDLARRSPLGWQCLYEHQVPFLREISELMAPEELGRRMRGLGRRPYAIQPFIVMIGHLGWRQQLMLDLSLSEGDPFPDENVDDLAFMVDWWARIQDGYRQDGFLLPEQTGATCPILDEPELELLRQATAGITSDRLAHVRRMAATLELYNFVLHGEQRDGIFGHGPYPQEDGSVLFVREFNDLRNDYLPWAATATRNPHDAVIIAYRGRDVAVHCDMFGSMTVQPHEFADRLEGLEVFGMSAGEDAPHPLDDDEIEAVQGAAANASEELYRAALTWDDHYKIAYGAPLFANHLWPLAQLAGAAPEMGERIMAACVETGDRRADELLASDVPSVWAHMATTTTDCFWPVVPG
jgi:hypothetical protein